MKLSELGGSGSVVNSAPRMIDPDPSKRVAGRAAFGYGAAVMVDKLLLSSPDRLVGRIGWHRISQDRRNCKLVKNGRTEPANMVTRIPLSNNSLSFQQ